MDWKQNFLNTLNLNFQINSSIFSYSFSDKLVETEYRNRISNDFKKIKLIYGLISFFYFALQCWEIYKESLSYSVIFTCIMALHCLIDLLLLYFVYKKEMKDESYDKIVNSKYAINMIILILYLIKILMFNRVNKLSLLQRHFYIQLIGMIFQYIINDCSCKFLIYIYTLFLSCIILISNFTIYQAYILRRTTGRELQIAKFFTNLEIKPKISFIESIDNHINSIIEFNKFKENQTNYNISHILITCDIIKNQTETFVPNILKMNQNEEIENFRYLQALRQLTSKQNKTLNLETLSQIELQYLKKFTNLVYSITDKLTFKRSKPKIFTNEFEFFVKFSYFYSTQVQDYYSLNSLISMKNSYLKYLENNSTRNENSQIIKLEDESFFKYIKDPEFYSSFYNSQFDMATYDLFTSIYNTNSIVIKKIDYFLLIPEFLVNLSYIFISKILIDISNYKRKNFILFKKSKILLDYFENIINSMKIGIISIENDNILYMNSKIEKELKIEKQFYENTDEILGERINENLIKDYFKSLKKSSNEIEDNIENDNFESSLKKFNNNNTNSANIEKFKNENLKSSNSINEKDDEFRDKIKSENSDFINLGNFNINSEHFYNVMIRKFYIQNNKYITDILIDDYTSLKQFENQKVEANLRENLFSKLAHEFKTPLLVLKFLINQYLYEKKHDENIGKHISNLSDYISFLINDIILNCNNNIDKSLNTSIEEVELYKIYEYILNIAITLAEVINNEPNRKIIGEFQDSLKGIYIFSDYSRLIQSLLNLISNSIKFTKKGYVKIKFSLIDEAVCISIDDTGTGVSEEKEKEINEFDQVNNINIGNTYSINKMGSGLGIRIVQAILKKLKHKWKFISKLGEGSNFSIFINKYFKKENINSNNHFITERKKSMIEHISFDQLHNSFNYKISKLKESIYMNDTIYYRDINLKENFFNFSLVKDDIYNENEYFHKNSEINNDISIIKTFYNSEVIDKNEVSDHKSKSTKGMINVNIEDEVLRVIPSAAKYSQNLIDLNKYKIESSLKEKKRNLIILADDTQMLRLSIKSLIEKYLLETSKDCVIIEGSDGIDILKLVIDNQNTEVNIKAIFTDESMTYMDGSFALKIIKDLESIGKVKTIKKIVITGYSEENELEKIRSSGADCILSKPVSYKQISEVLNLIC